MQTDKDNCDKILAFDSIYTNNHIQMYKLLLPYFEPEMQKKMAIYIKFMEFQYTLSYFKNHPSASRDNPCRMRMFCARSFLPTATGKKSKSWTVFPGILPR